MVTDLDRHKRLLLGGVAGTVGGSTVVICVQVGETRGALSESTVFGDDSANSASNCSMGRNGARALYAWLT